MPAKRTVRIPSIGRGCRVSVAACACDHDVLPVVELATRNALAIAAGHCFVIFLRDGFPVNILVAVTSWPLPATT